MTDRDYFVATGVVFSLSWLYRQIRIYFEHGIHHRAELSLTSNGFIQVHIPTNATWTVGQHYFIRFMTLGLHAWTIHPFTACSLPSQPGVKSSRYSSELIFLIRPQGGFTARLARLVESQPNVKIRVLLDGPYGGIDERLMHKSHRTLVIAGGSGAGWMLPFITSFLKQQNIINGSNSNPGRSLKIILATREVLTMHWFQEEVQQLLLSLPAAEHRTALEIEIYYTGSEDNGEKYKGSTQFLPASPESESSAVKLEQGELISSFSIPNSKKAGRGVTQEVQSIHRVDSRPDLASIIRKEAGSVGSGHNLGVFVCGPLSMQSDVANAVAFEQLNLAKKGTGEVVLHMEHFSWA